MKVDQYLHIASSGKAGLINGWKVKPVAAKAVLLVLRGLNKQNQAAFLFLIETESPVKVISIVQQIHKGLEQLTNRDTGIRNSG